VTQAFEKLQQQVGRKFNVHRTYAVWDTPEPTGLVKWDLANGYIPALSIKAVTKSGKRIKWADIAAGKQDATIISQARALKATGKRIILTFHHEPENDPANGTPADFVAAWRHYVTVFRQQGASNVEFNWIMMTYTFNPQSHKNPDAWYPGDQWVDWIGGDGYNMFGCQPHAGWKSFADAFQYWRAWAAKHPSKPLFIAEWGSMEKPGDPNAKAQWFRDAAKTLAGWSQVHAVTYYDANHKCSWFADSSQQSLTAYAQLARASQQEATFVNR
jgi:beta-mannanase